MSDVDGTAIVSSADARRWVSREWFKEAVRLRCTMLALGAHSGFASPADRLRDDRAWWGAMLNQCLIQRLARLVGQRRLPRLSDRHRTIMCRCDRAAFGEVIQDMRKVRFAALVGRSIALDEPSGQR